MVTATAHLPVAARATDNRPPRAGYGDLPDEELMARLSSGDPASLKALYDRYGDLVYSTTRRVLRDAHLAEDIAQEIFLRLWRQPEKYVPQKGRFVSWLLSVTRNRAVDEVRSRNRRYRYETASLEEQKWDAPDNEASSSFLLAELADQRRAVKAALASLPREQRRSIELVYFGGFTNREVARLVGAPLGTVKTRIRLGMLKLRQAMKAIEKAQDKALGVSA